MRDIMETVTGWLGDGRPVALAIVAATWGSSPRQPGAKMAVTQNMRMAGSVSGGCVESAVAEEAIAALRDGRPRLLHYGVSDDAAWDVGLACGGRVSVYVEALDPAWWGAVCRAVQPRHAVVTVTLLAGPYAGAKVLIDDATDGPTSTTFGKALPPTLEETLKQIGREALERRTATALAMIDGLEVLIDVERPAARLILVGGAHVSQAVARLALLLGFDVAIIDPRTAFATPERFPGVRVISHDYPARALAVLQIDAETSIAVLTHDPKLDDPALRAALVSPAAYVGVLSGRQAHELRIARLTAAGVDPHVLARLHVPIGLAIGAHTPEEIALSILAEIVAVKNGTPFEKWPHHRSRNG